MRQGESTPHSKAQRRREAPSFPTPSGKDLVFNIGLGLLLHGKGLAFKDYSSADVASILPRARVRRESGFGQNEKEGLRALTGEGETPAGEGSMAA